ncbi:calcium-activated chloride channel-domain-containing protein [Globomyces pollinis-pini]|nr:calcium-activated chloride channel-domain-containing protein [Globomyces pollinis-pini]
MNNDIELEPKETPNEPERKLESISPRMVKSLNTLRYRKQKERDPDEIDREERELLLSELRDSPLPLNAILEEFENKIILFLRFEDRDLFRQINQFKETNPNKSMSAALTEFGSQLHSDALVKIAYEFQLDLCLKYDITAEKKTHKFRKHLNSIPKFVDLRTLHLFELLKKNIFLVLEKSVHEENHRYVQIIAPFEVLAKEAERISLRLPLTPECVNRLIPLPTNVVQDSSYPFLFPRRSRTLPKMTDDMDRSDIPIMIQMPGVDNTHVLKKRSVPFQYESISDFKYGDAERLGHRMVKEKFFSSAKRNELCHSLVMSCFIRLKYNRSSKSTVLELVDLGVYLQFFALHDGSLEIEDFQKTEVIEFRPSYRKELNYWAESFNSGKVPLEDIRTYFGESIGLYFVWVQFYVKWILYLSFLGVVVVLYGLYHIATQNDNKFGFWKLFDNRATPFFGYILCIWSLLFLKYWKRQSHYLSFIWDVDHVDKTEQIRPQWRASGIAPSPITGKKVPVESNAYKIRRVFTTIILFLAFIFMIGLILGNIALTAFLTNLQNSYSSYGGSFTSGVFAVIQIFIFYPVYTWLTLKLTEFENFRTRSEYVNSLIWKDFISSFLNCYGILFFMAIIKPYISYVNNQEFLYFGKWTYNCTMEPGPLNCQTNLITSIIIIFAGQNFLYQIFQVVYPYLIRTWKVLPAIKKKEIVNHDTFPAHMHESYLLPPYSRYLASEFSDRVTQLGYILFFGASFSLAPFLGYVNGVTELKVDVLKYVKFYQRPFVEPAKSIGAWDSILERMTFLSFLVTGATLAFNSKGVAEVFFEPVFGDSVTKDWRRVAYELVFLIVFEHLILFSSIVIHALIPDVPEPVRIGRLAEEHIERLRLSEDSDESDWDDDDDQVKNSPLSSKFHRNETV